jgi:hypothetical protein
MNEDNEINTPERRTLAMVQTPEATVTATSAATPYEEGIVYDLKSQYTLTDILRPKVVNFQLSTGVQALEIEHVGVDSADNRALCQQWIDSRWWSEERYRLIMANTPQKAQRSKTDELSAHITSDLWNFLCTRIRMRTDKVPSDSVEMNRSICKELLIAMGETFTKKETQECLLEKFLKMKDIKWRTNINQQYALTTIIGQIDNYLLVNNLSVSSDNEYLNLIFNLMPYDMVRYMLHQLKALQARERGTKGQVMKTPLDEYVLESKEEFLTLVQSKKLLLPLITAQLAFVDRVYGFDTDYDKIQGNQKGVPSRALYPELVHLIPKLVKFPNKQDNKEATPAKDQQPTKVRSAESGDRKRKERWSSDQRNDKNNRYTSFGQRQQPGGCFNCRSKDHIVKACEYMCTKCLFKDGSVTHMGKGCPKYQVINNN